MLKTIIFDLSEVFVAGMYGIEIPLARILSLPENTIIPIMRTDELGQLFRGEITEERYLQGLLTGEQWDISLDTLKKVIRRNFHGLVPGMGTDLLRQLASTYRLVILSDHASEWVKYLEPIHQALLSEFSEVLFSFNERIQGTKKQATTFQKVLGIIGEKPEECLFVDDLERNVKVAAEVGIPGIHFTSAPRLINVEFPQFGITVQ